MGAYRRLHTSISVAVVLLVSAAASAQTSTDAERLPRVQLGVTAGAIIFFPIAGALLSVPVHPRFAFEATAEFLPWIPIAESDEKYVLVQAQVRQRWGSRRTWQKHVTYGLTTAIEYSFIPEVREPRLDRSVIVYPGYRRLRVSGPPVLHGGIGAERVLSNRVVLRWDVQGMMPVGGHIPAPRATVGIAWQGGRRR